MAAAGAAGGGAGPGEPAPSAGQGCPLAATSASHSARRPSAPARRHGHTSQGAASPLTGRSGHAGVWLCEVQP